MSSLHLKLPCTKQMWPFSMFVMGRERQSYTIMLDDWNKKKPLLPFFSFRVEDDFEKMLQVSSKPKLKPKPNIASKPTIPRKPVILEKKLPSSPTQTRQPAEEKVQNMDEIDIFKYIKENESLGNEEPSLFWSTATSGLSSRRTSIRHLGPSRLPFWFVLWLHCCWTGYWG